jgi:hypothetical protein
MHLLKGLTVKHGLNIPEIGCWSRTIDADHNMNFQKLVKAPAKHSGIIVRDTEIFLGADDEFAHLSLDSAIEQQNDWFANSGKNCSIELPEMFAIMEFVPHNTNIRKTGKLSKGAQNSLEKYAGYRQQGCNNSGRKIKVIPVSGVCKHIRTKTNWYKQGDQVRIQDCEYYVKDHIKQAQEEGYDGVWIIASQYCQRSFTIGKIYIVILSYDAGAAGGTAQRTSRVSSPALGKTAGLIISNSFDHTRDEKIDSMLSSRAKSRMARTGESFVNAGRSVKRGFSIFTLNDNGDQIQLEWDAYTYRLALQQNGLANSLAREFHKKVKENAWEEKFMEATRRGNPSKGKNLDGTYVDPEVSERNRKNRSNPTKGVSEAVILNALKYITENMDIVHRMATDNESKCILECIKGINNNNILFEEFFSQFNIEPSYLIDMLEEDIYLQELTNQLISVKLHVKVREHRQQVEDYWNENEVA